MKHHNSMLENSGVKLTFIKEVVAIEGPPVAKTTTSANASGLLPHFHMCQKIDGEETLSARLAESPPGNEILTPNIEEDRSL